MKCNNCGAEIGNSKFCEFCGAQISYDMRKEQEQNNKQGCPKCGSSNIQFERENQGEVNDKGTKRVIYRTVGFCKDCGHTWYTARTDNTPQKSNLVWWVLGWIFFFPAPVMVLIWRKKNTWDVKLKLGVTAAFWIALIILGRTNGNTRQPAKEVVTPSSNTVTEEVTNDKEDNDVTETIKEEATVDTNDQNATDKDAAAGDNPMDIININNHPVYYGDVSAAKEVWENYLDKEVLISSNKKFKDNTLIVTKSYGTNDTKLNDIQIYLGNTGEDAGLDEALDIARSYLPIDNMRDYYSFEDSYILSSKNMYARIIHYKITDEGNAIREETREDSVYTMPYEIYVWINGEDGIDYIRIHDDLDNAYWKSNYKKNGIERIEWNYDFLE